MFYRIYILLCFLSIFLNSTNATCQVDIGKLQTQLRLAKEDTNKVTLYRAAVAYYNKLVPDSAYKYAEDGLKLSEKLNYVAGQAYMSGQLGSLDRTEGRMGLAKVRLQNSLELYERMSGYKKNIAQLKNELGVVVASQGNFDEATGLFLSALKIYETLGDTLGKVQTYIKLGSVNDYMDNLDKSHAYFESALGLARAIKDTIDIAYLYNNMCINEGKREHFDEALKYCEQGLALCTTKRFNDVSVSLLLNAGIVYKEKHDENKALSYFNRALSIAHDNNMQYDIPNLLLNIAMLENATPHAHKIPLLNEALASAKEQDQKSIVANIYETISDVYVEENNYKDAYIYKDSAYDIRHQLFTIQKNKEIANLEALYDLDKSHHKVDQLEQENRSRDFQRNIFIVIAAIIAIALLLLFVNYKKTIALNKELQTGKEKLALANQVKDKIFSVIGHDLRTPTHTIIGMLKVLDSENHGMTHEEEAKVFKVLKEQSEASLETLNKLLLWGSRQIKGISLERELFDVTKLIESNLKLMHENALEKHVEIVNKVPEGTMVYADVSHFDFIVRNLLSNGLKFSKDGGKVEIGIGENSNNEFVCFYVRDKGVGIKVGNTAHIFGLNSTSSLGTSNEKGTGLGLVLCRDFVELNGGKIWVESEDGKGATFYFTMKKKNN